MADLFLNTAGADAFAIAHCNFSLRGEESDGDEMLVREWAAANGVRCFVKRFDTERYAKDNGISIEMAARDLRYAWFAELCSEHGYDVLSVAHNANDNAETLMLNLLRGTGLNGLHGMAEVQHRSAPMGVVVFRPLLEYTRKQIEGYVLVHRVPYRHDSSNFQSDYKRNKIRNEVFPVFEKMNPSFVRTLNREIGYFAEAGSIVDDWCRSQLPSVISYDNVASEISSDATHLHVNTSALLSISHWRYLLYYILEPYGFNQQTLASIESLLTSSRTIPGKRFESPTHTLITGRGVLTLVPSEVISSINTTILKEGRQKGGCAMDGVDMPPPARGRERLANGPVDLCSEQVAAGVNGIHPQPIVVVRGAGTYDFNGVRFTVELFPWDNSMPLKQPQGTLILDADRLAFPFVCRKWRQGDWLNPLGMRGKKKVSDLFADLKYDAFAKDAAVIVVDTQTKDYAAQQHIAALMGVRIDDRYKVTQSTETVIRLTVI
jgi:tRNA(Ile)-lysidine synthase